MLATLLANRASLKQLTWTQPNSHRSQIRDAPHIFPAQSGPDGDDRLSARRNFRGSRVAGYFAISFWYHLHVIAGLGTKIGPTWSTARARNPCVPKGFAAGNDHGVSGRQLRYDEIGVHRAVAPPLICRVATVWAGATVEVDPLTSAGVAHPAKEMEVPVGVAELHMITPPESWVGDLVNTA
jgi:hypothetical protein